MDLELKGKTAVVTGASRGIGRAIAETLAAEGMRLVLVARSQELLDAVAGSLYVESIVQAADLREPHVAEQIVAATVARFGGIDLLVNVAGATKRGDFLELTDEDWADGYALKFYGAMRLCREAWPHLRESRGSIVNISGVGGRTGSADFTIGGSVNAALLNLTKALADRGIRDGVRVNAINPGSILTERLRARVETLSREEQIDFASAGVRMAQKLRVARFGDPAEVARAVAFLASPAVGYCQGVILDVDGGQTRTL
ncbi:MAG: SDR family NAD(P)-dependent oxidoreductase [Thermoanaerobaculia bacterium]